MRIPVTTKKQNCNKRPITLYSVGNILISSRLGLITMRIVPLYTKDGDINPTFTITKVGGIVGKEPDITAELDTINGQSIISVCINDNYKITSRYDTNNNIITADYTDYRHPERNKHVLVFNENDTCFINMDNTTFRYDHISRKWVCTGEDVQTKLITAGE